MNLLNILIQYAGTLYLVLQNVVVIEFFYLNYLGVSKYASVLNTVYVLLVLFLIDFFVSVFDAKKKHVRFVLLLIFQCLNMLLLCSFGIGIKYLGMPFEYDMVLNHAFNESEFMVNHGFSHGYIAWLMLLVYILITSYFLAFKLDERPKNNNDKKVFIFFVVLSGILLSNSITREPYLLSIFGHGFDGAPRDITDKDLWPKINKNNEYDYNISFRPIVLITIDAARSDVLDFGQGILNYPTLSKIQTEGGFSKFKDAYSVCPVTYCGLLGILGSTYWNDLKSSGMNLQDYLTDIGYRTYSILSGDHSRYHGLRTMFGNNVFSYYDGTMFDGNPNQDDLVIKRFQSIEINDKTFVHLHFMSMHSGGVIKDRDKLDKFVFQSGIVNNNEYYNHRYKFASDQIYSYIEKVFYTLYIRGVLDKSIVIISSDHGEMLGEKGMIGHAANRFPFDPSIHIPLLIFDLQHRYNQQLIASQVDIAPTIIAAINGKIPANWNGVPLQFNARRCAVRSDTDAFQAYIGVLHGLKYKYIKYRNVESAYNLTIDSKEQFPITDANYVNELKNNLLNCLELMS